MAADARGRLWKYLRGLLPAGCHATRIENEIGSGFPDVHFTYREVSGTIELKDTDHLPMGKAGLRKSQIDWIEEETQAGGLVLVFVQYKKESFIIGGLYAKRINEMDRYELETYSLAHWSKGQEDPDVIYGLLMNKA